MGISLEVSESEELADAAGRSADKAAGAEDRDGCAGGSCGVGAELALCAVVVRVDLREI